LGLFRIFHLFLVLLLVMLNIFLGKEVLSIIQHAHLKNMGMLITTSKSSRFCLLRGCWAESRDACEKESERSSTAIEVGLQKEKAYSVL
jgi:hypothetical protein